VLLAGSALVPNTDHTVKSDGNQRTVAFTKESLIKLRNNAAAELGVAFQGKST